VFTCLTLPFTIRGLSFSTESISSRIRYRRHLVMGMRLTCPICQHRMALANRSTGPSVRCSRCRTVLTVAVASSTGEPAAMNYRVVAGAGGMLVLCIAGMIAFAAAWASRQRFQPAVAELPRAEAIERPGTPASQREIERPPAHPTAAAPEWAPAAATPNPAAPPAVAIPPIPAPPRRSEDELRKGLLLMTELKLNTSQAPKTSELVLRKSQPAHFTLSVLDSRADLVGLPLRRAADCELDRQSATNLAFFAGNIRRLLNDQGIGFKSVEQFGELLAQHLGAMADGKRYDEAAVPAMMQILCVENGPIREALIHRLIHIEHPSASEAMVKLALFDVSEKVRSQAVAGLALRPPEEYRSHLLAGFRHPWPPVAEHAAGAMVSLEDRAALPDLKKLAEQADPAAPYDEGGRTLIREVARINHLSNCLMCHAPATGKGDLARGRIPVPGQPLPRSFEYYNREDGIFVRADVTYLRQDFSIMQPVENAQPWPEMQRFDFLVRSRPATAQERARQTIQPASYPQRTAALYAIQELSKPPRVPGS
jgi:hypothetical protein